MRILSGFSFFKSFVIYSGERAKICERFPLLFFVVNVAFIWRASFQAHHIKFGQQTGIRTLLGDGSER